MQQLQNFIAGSSENFHEFFVSMLILAAMTGLFIIYMNKEKVGASAFNAALFILWLAMPVVRFAFSVWNLFVGIVDRVRKYEMDMRLTPEEEAELNENVFNQPLGI